MTAERNCLVVDDSGVVRKVARRMLEPHGFIVSEAENGQEALDHCKDNGMPLFILLDWNMPVMDGISFLQELRVLPNGQEPVVVFCTTENELSFIQRALESGANEYIMKPFDEEILLGKLRQLGLVGE